MVVRNPYRPQATGLVRESAGDIFQKELARAGAGLIGGIGQAVIQQPLQQMFGAEGSIGREFVSPEIREMKRQEAESMAAQRVAPYYEAQQKTFRQQMQEAGQTGRTGMTLQGQMEQKQLGEGSDILQLAMKLQASEKSEERQLQFKEWLAKLKAKASGRGNARFKNAVKFYESVTRNPQGYDPKAVEIAMAMVVQAIGADKDIYEMSTGIRLEPTPKTQEETQAKIEVAKLGGEADVEEAKVTGKSRENVAATKGQAQRDVAGIKAEAQKAVQEAKNTGMINVANIEAASAEERARIAKAASEYSDDVKKEVAALRSVGRVPEAVKVEIDALSANIKAFAGALKNAKSPQEYKRLLQEYNKLNTQQNAALNKLRQQPADGTAPGNFQGSVPSRGVLSVEEMARQLQLGN